MKKTLSIIMALTMILSVCFFSVSAAEATVGSVAAGYTPEGTPITNAAEFAAMAADGKYYLANDITLDATWNAGAAVSATYKENTAFTGTLDGNGKTITTTAPLFANLQGTVKNVTIDGKLADTELHNANVAMWTNGTVVIDNVYTKADITAGNTCGGMLGYCATGSNITITNSRNDADITCSNQLGGMIGYVQDDVVVIDNCENYGNLTTTNYAAGILGRFGRDKGALPESVATITNCANYGKVVGGKGQNAGMLGYLVGGAKIANCVNYGEIVNETAIAAGIFGSSGDPDKAKVTGILIQNCFNYAPVSGATYVGGIAGYLGKNANSHPDWNYRIENSGNYGDLTATGSATMYVAGVSAYGWGGSIGNNGLANGLVNCFNVGNITVNNSGDDSVKVYVSGIIGYFNTTEYSVENCFNAGTINSNKTAYATLIAWNNRGEGAEGVTADLFKNNYSVASGDIPAMYNGPVSEAVGSTVVTAEQIADGTVAGLINEAAGATIYYQAIGTDKAPTLIAAEDGSNAIIKNADGTFSNPAKEEPSIPETPKTGDSAVIFAVIAVISILGAAVVAKKREN